MRTALIGFLLGLLIGAGAMWLIPAALGPYLPPFIMGPTLTLDGTVVAKRPQDDRLLMTIRTDLGTTLATFENRVDEIDLLVDTGDSISLGTKEYEPFLTDPAIRRVVKPDPRREMPKPEEPETIEVRPVRDHEELFFSQDPQAPEDPRDPDRGD